MPGLWQRHPSSVQELYPYLNDQFHEYPGTDYLEHHLLLASLSGKYTEPVRAQKCPEQRAKYLMARIL